MILSRYLPNAMVDDAIVVDTFHNTVSNVLFLLNLAVSVAQEPLIATLCALALKWKCTQSTRKLVL